MKYNKRKVKNFKVDEANRKNKYKICQLWLMRKQIIKL